MGQDCKPHFSKERQQNGFFRKIALGETARRRLIRTFVPNNGTNSHDEKIKNRKNRHCRNRLRRAAAGRRLLGGAGKLLFQHNPHLYIYRPGRQCRLRFPESPALRPSPAVLDGTRIGRAAALRPQRPAGPLRGGAGEKHPATGARPPQRPASPRTPDHTQRAHHERPRRPFGPPA